MTKRSAARGGLLAAFAVLLVGASARAEVTGAAPDGFRIAHRFETAAAPGAVWDVLIDPSAWWSPAHTYSGDAASLSLAPEAGSCWCENWDGGSVEHGRVLSALPGSLLRVEGAFGPLQALSSGAVMTFEITPQESGSSAVVALDYVVGGPTVAGLEAYASAVDAVLGEQMTRLAARLEAGEAVR